MENIEQRVKKIVAEQLGVNEADIKNESSFVDDLGADSLDTVELVMALEEEFETEIPDEEAEKITTVQQADRLRRRAPARAVSRLRARGRRARAAASAAFQAIVMSRRRVVVTGLGIVSPGRHRRRRGLGEHPRRHVGHRPDHALRRVGVPVADRRRGEGLRRHEVPVRQGSAPLRHLHPLRPRRRRWRRSRTRASSYDAATTRARRRVHRLRHRRPADDRGHAQRSISQGGLRKISPFFVPGSIINMIAGLRLDHYGYKGPNLATVTACTTANHCIGEAARLIEYGDADVMIAGGAEVDGSPLGVGGFCAVARAVRRATTIPRRASRPWDVGPRRLRAGRGRGRAGARGATSTRRRAARASTASSPATA